jgi:nitrate/nitrite transport system substrate-binding protein
MTKTVQSRALALPVKPSRRDFLNLTGAAAVAAAAKLALPNGAFAQAPVRRSRARASATSR